MRQDRDDQDGPGHSMIPVLGRNPIHVKSAGEERRSGGGETGEPSTTTRKIGKKGRIQGERKLDASLEAVSIDRIDRSERPSSSREASLHTVYPPIADWTMFDIRSGKWEPLLFFSSSHASVRDSTYDCSCTVIPWSRGLVVND